MSVTLLMLLAVLTTGLQEAPSAGFEDRFTGRCLRLDTYHSGHAGVERVSLDRWRVAGAWAGTRTRLVDPRDMGAYRLELRAPDGTPLYRRGYASVFGEYATTRPGLEGVWRTFHESLRMPEPRSPARVVILKRDRRGRFQELWSADWDPGDPEVHREPPPEAGRIIELRLEGPPEHKVDLLVLADGYSAEQQAAFREDLERLAGVLFSVEPFATRRGAFNVRGLFVPSRAPGIRDPARGRHRASAFGCTFGALGLDRYVLTLANRRLRELAARVPYDVLVILANTEKYGGGGIYGLYSTCAADARDAGYVFVHELGHAFGGLGDEYYSSAVTYEDLDASGTEPWEPNVSATADREKLEWADLVEPETPLPTPWDQEGYDRLVEEQALERRRTAQKEPGRLEALRKEQRSKLLEFLRAQPYEGKVGAFEGAGYRRKGLYRPHLDDIMFSKLQMRFGPVSRRALETAIDLEAR